MCYGKVSSKGERAALGGQGETAVGIYSPVRLCPAHERSESCVSTRWLGSWPVPRGGFAAEYTALAAEEIVSKHSSKGSTAGKKMQALVSLILKDSQGDEESDEKQKLRVVYYEDFPGTMNP
jgi:hypothetical protein